MKFAEYIGVVFNADFKKRWGSVILQFFYLNLGNISHVYIFGTVN